MSTDHHDGFAETTARALKWNYLGAFVRAGSTILVNAILARLLGPAPFGVAAVAWMFFGVGFLVSDLGFGAALVQKTTVDVDDIRYATTMQLLLGILMAAANWVSAGPVSRIFRQPDAITVIRAVSVMFIFQAMGQTASSLLKRNMDFKSLQVAQVASYFVAYVGVGIPMAFWGAGVWALVVAQVLQSFLNMILVYRKVRHSVRPSFRTKDKAVVNYGLKVVGTNLVNWAITNTDNVIVGRVFGAVPLGLYSRFYQLVTVPMNNVVTALQGVLFPAYSRSQDDDQTLRRVYLASIAVVALVIAPVFCTIAVVPRTVTEATYGTRWLSGVPLLVPLALAMPFHAIMALAGPVMWAKGVVEREFWVQSLVTALFVVSLGVASHWSLLALTWAVFAVYLVRVLLMTHIAVRLLQLGWTQVLSALRGSAVVSVGCSVTTFLVDSFVVGRSGSVWLRLPLDVLVAAIVAGGLVWGFPRAILGPEVVQLLTDGVTRLPKPLRNRIRAVQSWR